MTRTAEAVVLRQPGAPEMLRLETVAVAEPGPGEVLVRQQAAGVNFHDIYVRNGSYQTLPLPGVPGLEGVGTVEAVGQGVSRLAVGQRIAWMDMAYGGYAQWKVLDAAKAVPVPDAIDSRTAAAIYLKGLTAHVLADQVHALKHGERVLVHAAAGGVGRLLVQMARARGCRVIGTAGTPDKAALARAAGCDAVIVYRSEDVAARVMDLTDGAGVDVVYDAVGRDTFEGSFAALGLRGHLVNYGQASGPVPPLEIARLGGKSLTISRPFVWAYLDTPEKLRAAAAAVFGAVADGSLKVELGGVFPLGEAARAHAALEARETGPFVLDC